MIAHVALKSRARRYKQLRPQPRIILPKQFHEGRKTDHSRQALFVEAGRRAMAICKEEVAKVERTGVDALRQQGLQVVEKIDTQKFQDLLKPTFAELGKRFGETTISRIRDQK